MGTEIKIMTKPKSQVSFTKARKVIKPVELKIPTPKDIDDAPAKQLTLKSFFLIQLIMLASQKPKLFVVIVIKKLKLNVYLLH